MTGSPIRECLSLNFSHIIVSREKERSSLQWKALIAWRDSSTIVQSAPEITTPNKHISKPALRSLLILFLDSNSLIQIFSSPLLSIFIHTTLGKTPITKIYAKLMLRSNQRIYSSKTSWPTVKIASSFTPGRSEWTTGLREKHGDDLIENGCIIWIIKL